MDEDILKFMFSKTQQNHELMLMVDANEELCTHNNEWCKWFSKENLVDPSTMKHIIVDDTKIYSRGSEKIDCIFALASSQHLFIWSAYSLSTQSLLLIIAVLLLIFF